MLKQVVRGPLLIPRPDGHVDFHSDGALAGDECGVLTFAGDWNQLAAGAAATRESDGVMLPPLLDIHTHVPQHPVRGRFLEGIPPGAKEGTLLAGLNRNVFPAEARCHAADQARRAVDQFRADTLSHGVVGGAAYMMVSAQATSIALASLPATWSVGLVMMNQNCPADLRTDEDNLERDVERLAEEFGRRLIVTDRFAVAVDTPLRQKAAKLARRFDLRTQTHLNEQCAEKNFVERQLYPQYSGYTDVYRRDGLLDQPCIVAHCIHMRPEEWTILARNGSTIAHCPTSNFHLGSGRMQLAQVMDHKIPFALATDVGASPTVSMLAEMGRFLQVQAGVATAEQALYLATLAPAKALGLDGDLGQLIPGKPMSFIEVRPADSTNLATASQAVAAIIPANLDDPQPAVRRVTLAGKVVFESHA
ncbi:MAG: amidohydrolase family protein [Tepidisphaeraceae bacterium]